MEAALVPPAYGQPDARTVVHQHIQTCAGFVAKQVGCMRVCRTKYHHHHHHHARVVSLPARMSMGVMASHTATMRIS
jgi:hypothetical protein